MLHIHGEIHRQRKSLGLTQEQLAEKMHVSRQAVAQWERGESAPDIDKLIPLAEILHSSLDVLLKGPDNCSASGSGQVQEDSSLISFLCRAKKKTYASGEMPHGGSCRPESQDLQYREGEYFYLDSYFGGERFTGEEVLYHGETPLWAMNYSGRVLSERFRGDFLKEALAQVQEEHPFRGPAIFTRGDDTYLFRHKGDFPWFQGEEEIYCKQEKVYECRVHGGMIK